MDKGLKRISGEPADAGLLDDGGHEVFMVVGGPHDGHLVEIISEKHNCGAYGESVSCSCGSSWQSAMYGCWQQGHQREEAGSQVLAAYLRAYREGAERRGRKDES